MREARQYGWEDREVEVNREDLIATLKTNLEKHRQEYAEALAGYKLEAALKVDKAGRRAIEALEDSITNIKGKISRCDPANPEERMDRQIILTQQVSINLPVPQDHSRSYEVAIKMAEWEVNPTVKLQQSQFQCFVLDDWDWGEEWRETISHYNKKIR